jgi:ABC-2 type transport system permease protein
MGSTIGSYFGLILIAAYSLLGILHQPYQIIKLCFFIVAVFLFFYFGFEGLATVVPNLSSIIASLGMQDHFKHEPRRIRHKR